MALDQRKWAKNIGIDAGGVLFVNRGEIPSEDTSSTNFMEDAIKIMRDLKQRGHRLFLISFAGKRVGQETKDALKEHAPDCIMENDMYIVNKRTKKGILCNQLNIDIMIDDRIDVLEKVLEDSPKTKCILFGGQKTDNPHIIHVDNWVQLIKDADTI